MQPTSKPTTFSPVDLSASSLLAFAAFDIATSQSRLALYDGSQIRYLSPPTAVTMHVSWSPDGRYIAFEACEGNGSECASDMEIYVLDVDGESSRNVSANPAEDRSPSWSPDGQLLVFASNRTGNQDLFIVGADGSGLTQLTSTPEYETSPEWSPDGGSIAFERTTYSGTGIWTAIGEMSVDGEASSIVATEGTDPRWSPTDGQIAFHCSSGTHLAICGVNRDGSPNFEIALPDADIFGYDWSPDGRLIAFTSNLNGGLHIYTACPRCGDASNLQQLTTGLSNDQDPRWSPAGNRIAYSKDGNLTIMSSAGDVLRQFSIRVLGPASWQPLSQLER